MCMFSAIFLCSSEGIVRFDVIFPACYCGCLSRHNKIFPPVCQVERSYIDTHLILIPINNGAIYNRSQSWIA